MLTKNEKLQFILTDSYGNENSYDLLIKASPIKTIRIRLKLDLANIDKDFSYKLPAIDFGE